MFRSTKTSCPHICDDASAAMISSTQLAVSAGNLSFSTGIALKPFLGSYSEGIIGKAITFSNIVNNVLNTVITKIPLVFNRCRRKKSEPKSQASPSVSAYPKKCTYYIFSSLGKASLGFIYLNSFSSLLRLADFCRQTTTDPKDEAGSFLLCSVFVAALQTYSYLATKIDFSEKYALALQELIDTGQWDLDDKGKKSLEWKSENTLPLIISVINAGAAAWFGAVTGLDKVPFKLSDQAKYVFAWGSVLSASAVTLITTGPWMCLEETPHAIQEIEGFWKKAYKPACVINGIDSAFGGLGVYNNFIFACGGDDYSLLDVRKSPITAVGLFLGYKATTAYYIGSKFGFFKTKKIMEGEPKPVIDYGTFPPTI